MKKLFVLLSIFVLLIFSSCSFVPPTGDTSVAPSVTESSDPDQGKDENLTQGPSLPGIIDSDYRPHIINATENPEKLSGSPLEIVKGQFLRPDYCIEEPPPKFEFPTYDVIVQARAVESYDSIYQKLSANPNYTPLQYRIIKMETQDVIRGENIPTEFLYLIPNDLFVDFTAYDTLLIAMKQIGVADYYTIINKTQGTVEALPLPLFADYQSSPELGSIIAFTDGIFDESLWQTDSWLYGYQFARLYLNEEASRLVVKRGCTMEYAIEKILNNIADSYYKTEDSYITLDFTTQQAINALNYVKPFENGVFSQEFFNSSVIFRRYINGCQTDETVEINLETEKVTYSNKKYTKADLEAIESIADHVYEKAELYKTTPPQPFKFDTDDKELIFLSVFGRYEKIGKKTYGIIKITWQYEEEPYGALCQDEAYIIYFGGTEARLVTNDELESLRSSLESLDKEMTNTSTIDGFHEYLEYMNFDDTMSEAEFNSFLEQFSYNGESIIGNYCHADGDRYSEYYGGISGVGFSLKGQDFDDYTEYTKRFSTSLPLTGLVLPYGLTFDSTLDETLQRTNLMDGFELPDIGETVSNVGEPESISISKIETSSGAQFLLEYDEVYEVQCIIPNKIDTVWRYVRLYFDADTQILSKLELCMVEHHPAKNNQPTIDSFPEYLDYMGFDENMSQLTLVSLLKNYSYNGEPLTLYAHHWDSKNGCGFAGGGKTYSFSNATYDYESYSQSTNKISTEAPITGLTLPYGIAIGDSLTDVLTNAVPNLIVDSLPKAGEETVLDSTSNGVLSLCKADDSNQEFQLKYEEIYQIALSDGAVCDVTRYVKLSFDGNTKKLIRFEIYVGRHIMLKAD